MPEDLFDIHDNHYDNGQIDHESHLVSDQGQYAHLEPAPTSEVWHSDHQAQG